MARAGGSVDIVATAEDKAAAAPVQEFAQELGVDLVAVPLAMLAPQRTPTRSGRVPARYGGGSLCEAAALAAAGRGAVLTVTRVISADGLATVAIAERNEG